MKTILTIQGQSNTNKWVDLSTYGETLDEVRDEIQEYREMHSNVPLRIIQRTIVITDQVIEDHSLWYSTA